MNTIKATAFYSSLVSSPNYQAR